MLMWIVNLQEVGNGLICSLSQIYLTMNLLSRNVYYKPARQMVGGTQSGGRWSPVLSCFSLPRWSPGLTSCPTPSYSPAPFSGSVMLRPIQQPPASDSPGNTCWPSCAKMCLSWSLRGQVGLRSIKDAVLDLISSGRFRIDLGHWCSGVTFSCV